MDIDSVVGSGDSASIGPAAQIGERFRPNDRYWYAMTRTVESCLEPDFDKLKQLMKSDPTKPSLALIQEVYRLYVTEGYFYGLDTLKEITRVKPVFDPEFIHVQYQTLINVDLGNLKKLRELTGVQPDADLVQNKYREYCRRLKEDINFNTTFCFRLLETATGIKPSQEIDLKVLDIIYHRNGKKDEIK